MLDYQNNTNGLNNNNQQSSSITRKKKRQINKVIVNTRHNSEINSLKKEKVDDGVDGVDVVDGDESERNNMTVPNDIVVKYVQLGAGENCLDIDNTNIEANNSNNVDQIYQSLL